MIYRNGYPARTWATRGGRLELEIPRIHHWSFLAMLPEPRWQIELALGPAQRWGISVIRSGEFQMILSLGDGITTGGGLARANDLAQADWAVARQLCILVKSAGLWSRNRPTTSRRL